MMLVIVSCVVSFQMGDTRGFYLDFSCTVPLILVRGSFTVTYAEK